MCKMRMLTSESRGCKSAPLVLDGVGLERPTGKKIKESDLWLPEALSLQENYRYI